MSSKLTPMMQQYLEIKSRYPDALLLYRMGDFYELFMEDAVTAAQILDIALTSRDKNAENPIPMCGVPYHAAENYIGRLVGAGYKVAVCDQVEDPKKAKGLVKREVTRVITPGLIVESQNLESKEPNYLAAVACGGDRYGLAYLDISTGEFPVVEVDSEDALLDELNRVSPKELLLPKNEGASWLTTFTAGREVPTTYLEESAFDRTRAEERILRHFRIHSLETFGIESMGPGIRAAGAVLEYVRRNHLADCAHLRKVSPYSPGDFMNLDEATVRNLEILASASTLGRKGSLLHVIDDTLTPMGGRLLQRWLRYPLIRLEPIRNRQEAVAELVEAGTVRTRMRECLAKMTDVERIVGRVSVGTANPRDMVALRRSLELLPELKDVLTQCTSPYFREILQSWDDLDDVALRIAETLVDDPPQSLSNGGVIRKGFHEELDRYTRLALDAKSWMAEYEVQERERTGIATLKVRYNKVFGYFIEVSKANLSLVPDHYVRKQTLVNAERYITDELKTFETQVLEADEKRIELEERLYEDLRNWVADHAERILFMARQVARVDGVANFAEIAARYDYCRPEVDDSGEIEIKDGRHPIIERFLKDGSFVPNDVVLDQRENQVLIITGPNMAGKSTILRQVALIVLLAQVGSFVPASSARIGLVDRIFTRVGASDDLVRGRSTFMVEMQETAHILHQVTPRSLVVLDEIGRGTSTFDGMSLAWAVAEYLHDHEGQGVKTLFATHYHELTELAERLPRVQNYNVAVKEFENEILFFHRLLPGGTNRSYGIHVAQLAGLPQEVIARAREILERLESGNHRPPEPRGSKSSRKRARRKAKAGFQMPLFQPNLEWLRDEIAALDLDRMTPLAALQTLYALKEQIKKEQRSTS